MTNKILAWSRAKDLSRHFSKEDMQITNKHMKRCSMSRISSVQLLSRVQLFVTPWTAAHQASLSITHSQSSLKLTSIELMMPSLWRPLLLLPPVPPRIRVFSIESTLHMRWPKYWSFSFCIIPPKEDPGPISFRMDWLDLLYLLEKTKQNKKLAVYWRFSLSVILSKEIPGLISFRMN